MMTSNRSRKCKTQPATQSERSPLDFLKVRIRRLKAENLALRNQNQELCDRLLRLQAIRRYAKALKAQNMQLRTENERLKHQFQQPLIHNVAPQIEAALFSVGIELNATLAKTIKSVSESDAMAAIEALKEAMTVSYIERPGGWLKRAIEEHWHPNEHHQQRQESQVSPGFDQWFKAAKAKGLVIASMREDDGQIYVFDQDAIRHSFEQMVKDYPLGSLELENSASASPS